jgi:hypothetical protein
MRAAGIALAALGLGIALLFFLLGGSGGRGRRPLEPAGSPETRVPIPSSDVSAPPERPAAPRTAVRQAAEVGAALPARSILEGTIIGENAPVPGATVELLQFETVRGAATTDARGRFRLESEALSGAGLLRVRARGFVTTERTLPRRPAGGTVMLGNLRLARGQRIEGRVVDGRGEGIPDATIRVEPYQAESDLLVAQGRSGAGGNFVVADCPPGTVLVSARAKGFGEVGVAHSPGNPLEILLEPGIDLHLRLLTPSGVPVAGASVLIQPRESQRTVKREAASDAEGRAVFADLAQSEWNVRVTHEEYRTSSRPVAVASGREEVVECIPWPAIEGSVRAPGGKPVPEGTRVLALPASAPSDRITAFEGGQEVRSDGSYRIGGLRGGDWRVRVSAPGYAPTLSAPVRLGIEGTGFAGAIELTAGAALRLNLARAGEPVAGAELEIFPAEPTPAQLWAFAADSMGATRAARSDADGLAEFPNLSPGTLWVGIYAEGSPPTRVGPFVIAEGQTPAESQVELRGGGLVRGRVLLGERVLPLAQVRIADRSGTLGFPLTRVCTEDGQFSSGWLPPGRYTVEAFPYEDPRSASGLEEIDLAAGEVKTVDIEL